MKPHPASLLFVPSSVACFRFAIFLLPATVTSSSSGLLDQDDWATSPPSRPYLAVLGPPALRFADAPAPALLPVVAAGGKPADENLAGKKDVVLPEVTPSPGSLSDALDSRKAAGVTESSDARALNRPKPILRDEFSVPARPEDFLPFFAFPPARRDGSLLSPGQIVPPPSSATYRQQ